MLVQIKPPYVIPDQVHCAVIRYHSRRVTCLEFHPTRNNILLSGDKVFKNRTTYLYYELSASVFSFFLVSGGHRKGKLESGILLKCMRRACTETYTLYKLIICGKVHICGPESLVIYFCIQVSMFPYFRFSPTNDDMVYSASSDGKVGYTDLETGTSSTLLNLNPNGWQVKHHRLSSLIFFLSCTILLI